jgi:hypothetical protein
MFTTSTTATAAKIRIFTHDDAPSAAAISAQVAELAATHDLTFEIVDVTSDPSIAIAAGVVGLPAITVHAGAPANFTYADEIARRECAVAGRRLGRWLDRKVASGTPAPVLTPAFA